MRISTIIHGTGADFEQRKKVLARREMDQAYKKHAKYTEKTPVIQALDALLSGKIDRELHEKDIAINSEGEPEKFLKHNEKQDSSEVYRESKELRPTEREAITQKIAHKAVGEGMTGAITYTNTIEPGNERYITGGEVSVENVPTHALEEKLQVLEKVRNAALTPANPSTQDLRVAASAVAQIQEVRSELFGEKFEDSNEEVAPFENVSFQVDIPERFQANVERNPQAETVFGKDLESLIFKRTFMKAQAVYASHAEMVKNSYRSYNEPLFSRTA